MTKLLKTSISLRSTIPFFNAAGTTACWPMMTLHLCDLQEGEILEYSAMGMCSQRRDPKRFYKGFNYPALNSGVITLLPEQPDAETSFLYGGFRMVSPLCGNNTAPGHGTVERPSFHYYCHHHVGALETTQQDVGDRWLTLICWNTSSRAIAGDSILWFSVPYCELICKRSAVDAVVTPVTPKTAP